MHVTINSAVLYALAFLLTTILHELGHAFAIIAIVSIIYPVMSGMVFIFPWQNAVNASGVTPASSARIERTSAAAVILLVVAAGVFRLILAPGIEL